MLWVLHFIPDFQNPESILAQYRDRLASGSYLAISHGTTDGNPTGQAEAIKLYAKTSDPVYFRSHKEMLRFFTGFELVEPGLVGSASWRPSGPGDRSSNAEMNTVSYGVLAANCERSVRKSIPMIDRRHQCTDDQKPSPVGEQPRPDSSHSSRVYDYFLPRLVGHASWRPSGPGDVSDDAHINAVPYVGTGRKL
jgi:S-adenosyl methyltransferase